MDDLKRLVHRYHAVVNSLDLAETNLLESHLRELKRVIRPGSRRLNWNSLGITDYVAKCNSAIGKFEGVVSTIKKTSDDITMKLKAIENAEMFKAPSLKKDGSMPLCKVRPEIS